MNRVELIDEVAKATEVSKKDTAAIISAIIETVTEAVANGDNVQLVGFGTFEAKKRASRIARNPISGATITVPAKTVPAFKASKKFKEAVNA